MAERKVFHGSIDDYWRARGYNTGTPVPGGYIVGSGPRPKPKKRRKKARR